MIKWLAGALLLATPPPEALQQASVAFAHADYASAETLAVAASQPPHRGAALYLVGLARFRRGEAAGAFAALEDAVKAEDPPQPAGWHYNRAACLYELGRFQEAEADYLEAAALDPSLAFVSLVNAGFAALDGGSSERAAALAKRARLVGSGSQDLVIDLETHIAAAVEGGPEVESSLTAYRLGLTAYDAGHFEEARDHFHQAVAEAPTDGRSRIMSGATALKLGDREMARVDLIAAQKLPLDSADRQVANDYLASMSHGLAARGRGLELAARLGVGFDTNYLQSGAVDYGTSSTTSTGAPLATASLTGAWRARPSPIVFTELSYALDQLAYLSSDAADYSVQQHVLAGTLELSPLEWLRVGVSGNGQIDLVGLSNFRVLQAGGGAGAWIGIDEHDVTTTRIFLDWARKLTTRSEFDYLDGDRVDARIAQSLRLGPTATELEYRYRSEAIGTLTQTVQFALPPMLCHGTCTQSFVIPFGYSSHTLGLTFRIKLASILHLGVSGGIEWRTYAADSYLAITTGDGTSRELDHRRREDERFFGSAFADLRIWKGLGVSLRYDLTVNQSNVNDGILQGFGSGCGPPGFVCHQFDYDNKNYAKHVVLLETGYQW